MAGIVFNDFPTHGSQYALGVTSMASVADADYTVFGSSDQIVLYTSITSPRVVTLPPAAFRAGQRIVIKDGSGSVSQTLKLTIARAGSDTIGPGSAIASFLLVMPGSQCELVSDGVSKWVLLSLSRQLYAFTTSDSFVAPPGVYSARLLLVGGGGGGGGGNSIGGGGGGGGMVFQGSVPVVPGTSYSYTQGAGGTGGAATANGNNGGNSTFGSLATAVGGGSGQGTATNVSGGGAYGASGSAYTIDATGLSLMLAKIPGCGGGATVPGGVTAPGGAWIGAGGAAGTNQTGGGGGGGSWGAGAAGGNINIAGGNAAANTGGGGGGGGASSNRTGGNGGSGYCEVEVMI